MEVKIFLTADFANTDKSGKLNVLGVFTQIHAIQLPVILPQMHVIAQLSFDSTESGKHKVIFIRVFDPDGKELLIIPNEFDVPKANYGQSTQVNSLCGIQGFMFEKFGSYEFQLFMEDSYQASVAVDVMDFSQSSNQQSEG